MQNSGKQWPHFISGKKTNQNAQGYYVSPLVFSSDLKIDQSHSLYVKPYFSPWIIQLMEYARNTFTSIPHTRRAQRIRNKNLRGFIILSEILQLFFHNVVIGWITKLFFQITQSTQAERESLTECKYVEIAFFQEEQDYAPFPLYRHRTILVIKSSHKFILTFLLENRKNWNTTPKFLFIKCSNRRQGSVLQLNPGN